MKIVSLVPSLTELLIDLGLGGSVVGRTKFCIHPEDQVKAIPKVGGTKNVNVQKVLDLEPDLIIANKEENQKEDIQALAVQCKILLTEIATYEEALEAILEIGKATNTEKRAIKINEEIQDQFEKLAPIESPKSVLYLIWQKPYMTIGNDTFIHDMLRLCGYDNVVGDHTRYPTLTLEKIVDLSPDMIFLSSEPFPFKQKHIDELQSHLPNSKILLVDGEYFSWYGSRMKGAPNYFCQVLWEANT